MKENNTEQMNASQVFCPNLDCMARGKIGEGTIVSHGKAHPRYRCKICGKTFSAKAGTMFEGLHKPKTLIVIVVTRFSYGCPIRANVQALGLDEQMAAKWRDRAGKHCHQVHRAVVQQGQLDLVQVQADEIRVKGHKMIAWMGLAIMVSTRLWLGGVVSLTRDRSLADRVLAQVRACCQPVCALLVSIPQQYPASLSRASQRDRRTRASLFTGMAAGVYRRRDQTDGKETRGRHHAQGGLRNAGASAEAAHGGTVLTTAFIERLNGTMRQRLASLTRKCQHAARRLTALESGMWLLGCTYNLCWPHHELSRREASVQGKRGEVLLTPAMASGLTDHVWSMWELLSYRVAPPSWLAPKRRRRTTKQTEPHVRKQQLSSKQPHRRPLLRLRKEVLCSTTS